MRYCFLCGQNNFRLIYSLPDKNIFECLNDHLFIGLNTKNSQNLYGKNYYQNSPYPSFFYQKYFQEKINLIRDLTGDEKPVILDVGCGWGQFLTVVNNNQLRYKGIDLSKDAIKTCQAKNLICQETSIELLAKKGEIKYTAITSFQTLEHLPNPGGFLEAAYKLLKKNGLILLTTPNNDTPLRKLQGPGWSVYNTPSHFVFYNKKTLKKLLMKAGFANVQVKTDGWRYLSLGYILARLNLTFFSNLKVPIPTDPFGDLVAWGFKR